MILPIPALALAEPGETVDELDRMKVLRLLVAERTLDPEADRRAVAHRKNLVVEPVGEDCLRVVGVDEIRALVIGFGSRQAPAHHVVAVIHTEARGRLDPRLVENRTESRTGPFGDAAPPFDAIVSGDLA